MDDRLRPLIDDYKATVARAVAALEAIITAASDEPAGAEAQTNHTYCFHNVA